MKLPKRCKLSGTQSTLTESPVEIPEERTPVGSRKRRRFSSPVTSPTGSLPPEESPVSEQPVKQAFLDAPEENCSTDATIRSTLSPLEAFLQQRLPYLEKNPLHTESKGTRATKFHDMHLAQLLRLRKIVFLESLLDVLSEICDKYVSKIVRSGRDLSPRFPEFEPPSKEDIVDEESLVLYFQNVNAPLSQVASGLLFENDWGAVFEFSPLAINTKSSADAAADAYLFIRGHAARMVSSEDNSDISLIRKYDLLNFVLWEYKNLGFGSQIFCSLQALEGEFDWTACQERTGRDDASCSCTNQHHRAEGKPIVTGRPTGPDATPTENIVKRSTISTVLADEVSRPSKRSRKDVIAAAQKKARCIVQQAWASAVAQDVTFMVISSGNEECIAIRHRESRSLFISPPFSPSETAGPYMYIKIYMGLYITAYQDAVSRATKLESGSLSPFAQSLLRLQIDARPDLPNATFSGLFNRYPVEVQIPPLNSAVFLRILDQIPYLDLRLHRHQLATMQCNEETWTLTRLMTAQARSNAMSTVDLSLVSMDNSFAFLDLERLFNETSRIWRVYLGVVRDGEPKPHYFTEPLVLKMSRDHNEGVALRNEFEKYQSFQRDGVTGVDGGISIAKRRSSTLPAHSMRHQKSYESALKSFHEKNYFHGNITREHVLFDVSRGEATLISLKDCGMLPADKAAAASCREKDRAALGLCLGIASRVAASKASESAKGDKRSDESTKARPRPVHSSPFNLDVAG